MIKWLFNWFFRFFKWKKLDTKLGSEMYHFQFIDDVPDEPKEKIIYFIGESDFYWQFVMLCPCGCDSLLHMNLIEDYDPYWTYKMDNDLITVTPSVDRTVGCKSHFFIKSGKLIWA